MRLDELRHRAQLIVSEQKELAKAFIQNQARASCVNDPSVLPDLCASHCTQLQVSLGWVHGGGGDWGQVGVKRLIGSHGIRDGIR